MIELGITLTLLVLGFFFGRHREMQHLESIRHREAQLKTLPVLAGGKSSLSKGEVRLVYGSVVIASDYFKNFVASLKTLFGGRLTSYESLLDRARREAILRMKTEAQKWGAQEVLDLELHTTFIDKLGIEVSAVGTAIKP